MAINILSEAVFTYLPIIDYKLITHQENIHFGVDENYSKPFHENLRSCEKQVIVSFILCKQFHKILYFKCSINLTKQCLVRYIYLLNKCM